MPNSSRSDPKPATSSSSPVGFAGWLPRRRPVFFRGLARLYCNSKLDTCFQHTRHLFSTNTREHLIAPNLSTQTNAAYSCSSSLLMALLIFSTVLSSSGNCFNTFPSCCPSHPHNIPTRRVSMFITKRLVLVRKHASQSGISSTRGASRHTGIPTFSQMVRTIARMVPCSTPSPFV